MDINHSDNFVSKLSNMTEDELTNVDLSFHLVRLQKEADHLYQSSCIQLAPDVIKWVKKNIVKTIQGLKVVVDNDREAFLVGDYNHEITVNDQIAKFAYAEYEEISRKVGKLVTALNSHDPEYPEKHTKFQIVKLTCNEQSAYFCYYRGVKKNSMRSSKKLMVLKNANQFVFAEDTVIDLGGNVDFFIVGDHIFIINVKSFENAFDYRDHIAELRDQNLTQIVSMPFFEGETSNKELFEESCKKFIHSRGLAQIKPETLSAVQENFQDRCAELSRIKSNVPEDEFEREKYMKKYGTIWDLFEYIDLDNRKIIFIEGASPRALIHFFADKIVRSFLTEDFKVAVAYE
ncbi:Kiwa anti-phage protein KwaB-like domain-containing protein [Paenibacillus sp. NPDC093718]|uniref:Kiwa anti-phage protein KwaB-like domain-containing protein n=1 Tax=Paenibacillus sp. NPDC093718 TaxID=3390601 RepID=UPI003D038B37